MHNETSWSQVATSRVDHPVNGLGLVFSSKFSFSLVYASGWCTDTRRTFSEPDLEVISGPVVLRCLVDSETGMGTIIRDGSSSVQVFCVAFDHANFLY